MDQMDVDQTVSSAKRPANSPPAAPSVGKRTRLSLPMSTINEALQRSSARENWQRSLADSEAENDAEETERSVHNILAALLNKIPSTSKNDFVSKEELGRLVRKDLQSMKAAVKTCLEDCKWDAAIPCIQKSSFFKSGAGSIDRLRSEPEPAEEAATMSSWEKGYLGRSADLVEGILKDCMTIEGHYARYVPHIQSSGTGKSRVHDELAKRMLYIPICLASPDAKPYPPSDPDVVDWFSITSGKEEALHKCNSFLYALMVKTKDALNEIIKEHPLLAPASAGNTTEDAERFILLLASVFRSKMSEGRTYRKHGTYRVNFYQGVVGLAEKMSEAKHPSTASRKSGNPQDGTERNSTGSSETNIVHTAANELIELLDPSMQCRTKPLVVICWDESHSLLGMHDNDSWSRFSELRRALRTIKDLPIFSVFLSTAWKFHLFSPDSQFDPSHRIINSSLSRFAPITEVGFDEFAVKVKPDGKTTLMEIASTHYMAHLGRALFATRYDCGSDNVKAGIISFAQRKLLCRDIDGMPLQLNKAEVLACLAVRLGLEFRTTSWLETEAEREQVERHMRLCLAATAGFHNMVTISPSEPLLAEAAFKSMMESSASHNDGKVFPFALLDHMDTSYLDPGNRGEVVAALLLLLARDKAVKDRTSAPAHEKPKSDSTARIIPTHEKLKSDGAARIITVSEFMKALLPAACSCCKKPVENLQPSSHFCSEEDAKKSLKDAFAGGQIWFNHFIKVNDFLMVNRQYLWSLISRGAALICANNHHGIDLVIPILFGDQLKPDAVSAILIQVKNDKSFKDKVRKVLFDLMDPFKVHLFAKDENPSLPVLRMVFALAADQSTITHPKVSKRRSGRLNSKHQFTAYDIWVAGVTNNSFGVITGDGEPYKHLLDRSSKIFNGYDLFDKHYRETEDQRRERIQARRRMHPGAATEIEHRENYISLEKPEVVTLDDSGDEEDSEDEAQGKMQAE